MCCMVCLCHTWISWFMSQICLAYVLQHHSCYKSQHTALQLLAVVCFRSLYTLSGTLYHCQSSHWIQYLSVVDI